MRGFARSGLAALALVFAGSAPAWAADCSSLASLALPHTTITKAELVAAGAFTPPPSPFPLPPGIPPASYNTMPAFCRITATLTPTPDSDIKIEVWMPAKNWNGKLDGIGNGVWAGQIGYFSMAAPLSAGYAVVATDTGHVGNGMSADFAVGHPQKLIDFGYRAVHEMTVKAKALIKAYYGTGPKLSLWTSCSTGGRQGLMEAYRYPKDYDGISAMAPANPMTKLMVQTIWTGDAALKDEAHHMTREKLAAVHKAFIAKCDMSDGVKDGLVSDPQRCSFDPAIIACKGKDGPDCLTKAQIQTMRDVYGGPVNPKTGAHIFPGFEHGSELQVGLLMMGPIPFPVATTYMADLVFHNPKWDFKSFDYGKDVKKAEKAGSKILDVPPSGLDRFFADGGKLLLSHGWADGLIPSMNTVDFYKALLKQPDKKAAEKSVRLFMVPGMGHCGGGNGPFLFDALSVIDNWAGKGLTPERIVVRRPPGTPPMTRPLCPYPEVATYSGHGSTNVARNFVCKAP